MEGIDYNLYEVATATIKGEYNKVVTNSFETTTGFEVEGDVDVKPGSVINTFKVKVPDGKNAAQVKKALNTGAQDAALPRKIGAIAGFGPAVTGTIKAIPCGLADDGARSLTLCRLAPAATPKAAVDAPVQMPAVPEVPVVEASMPVDLNQANPPAPVYVSQSVRMEGIDYNLYEVATATIKGEYNKVVTNSFETTTGFEVEGDVDVKPGSVINTFKVKVPDGKNAAQVKKALNNGAQDAALPRKIGAIAGFGPAVTGTIKAIPCGLADDGARSLTLCRLAPAATPKAAVDAPVQMPAVPEVPVVEASMPADLNGATQIENARSGTALVVSSSVTLWSVGMASVALLFSFAWIRRSRREGEDEQPLVVMDVEE